MTEPETARADVPDVRKSVTVPLPADEAFRIFTEQPAEWLPAGHTFIRDPQSISMEPRAGGRFYERGADGTEVTRGTIAEWAPPNRLVMTWRIGPNWRPVFDDEKASLIEVDFLAAGPDATEVVVTNTNRHRHGEIAGFIRSALDGPSPGETLQKYAEAVARHAATGCS
jgi:uncharacterized protein YndB with AHSA1/START domain